jgi:hypothetical protein
MKYLSLLLLTFLFGCGTIKNQTNQIDQIVGASCGTCVFGMTGDDCDLAIRFEEKFYYAEGASIDEFGDAHAEDGFCNVERQAHAKGEIKHGVFVLKSLELLPYTKE